MPTALPPLQLISAAFAPNEPIPALYTCSGKGISPALTWNEPPAGTRSFALIVDDPDAPGSPYVHWVIFNIPASVRTLPEAVPYNATLADGSLIGISSLYQGPCPPSGGAHHYYFRLYALDKVLANKTLASKDEVLKAMKGHILAQSELIGTFTR